MKEVIMVKVGESGTTERVEQNKDQREWIVALLLSIFIGNLGVDRFYMGLVGTGILKLITFGGCGIWWLIDVILIATNKLKDADGQFLKK